jgi:signal-transduction protein with cAMP-binding, CBS, and nucleotidyltransferase domain
MSQVMTAASTQAQPVDARAAAATAADLIRLPLATVSIITQADIARAIADGKDVNDVRVHAVMTTRPAILATTSIRDAATTMTAGHYRHLPVASDTGLLGVVDILDVCQALINTGHR